MSFCFAPSGLSGGLGVPGAVPRNQNLVDQMKKTDTRVVLGHGCTRQLALHSHTLTDKARLWCGFEQTPRDDTSSSENTL